MSKFGLGQLTVLGVRPAEFVEVAARAGYDAISPMLGTGVAGGWPVTPLRAGDAETAAMAKRLAETGLSIHIGDGFILSESVPLEILRAGISLMKDMGARAINIAQFNEDEGRGFDHFCQLQEWAQEADLTVLIEFTPLSRIAGLKDALTYRERAGGGNIAVMIDLLHLHRSGGKISDLAKIDQSLIGGVQLCDAAPEPNAEGYMHEARYERLIPGAGSLQIRELVAALPDETIFDLEVPLLSLEQSGASHEVRAKRVLQATREFLENRDPS